ncbi:Cystinosin [Ceratobasidium theobromae]|uniref:Cystinosin n=1 Tax=Ceratobasidium theobromae TaxID=1582974 RepID=A0A5N5QJ05_9AGAM|nr:Cystinosin [Ceratobasidium theobromae]
MSNPLSAAEGGVVLNARRKSVDGLSIDFVSLNIVGFASYTFYTINFLFNKEVREEYRRRHDGHDNSVQFNDVAFATHALILTLITFAQTLYYPRGPGQRLSSLNQGVIAFMAIFIAIDLGRAALNQVHLIDVLYHLGTFKLYVSIVKYIPQAFSNFNRKSTEGWSIGNVLLDFTGGILSLLQLLMDSFALDDWSSVTGNPVKFGLSMQSLAFGLLFIFQHYILYATKRPTSHDDSPHDTEVAAGESQPLLSLANMTTLPTFIELLSSLGLDEKGTPPPRGMSSGPDSNAMECTPSIQSPREPIVGNSPAIVIDAPDCVKVRSLGPSFRTRGARYAPYGAETTGIYVRRGSISSLDMPTIHSVHSDENSSRKLGTSPPPSSRLMARRRPSMANLTLDPDVAQSSTPISSLLRRRSPQPSPTTPGFRMSRRSSVASGTASPSPLTPPSVPALPTLPPIPSNFTFGSPGLRAKPSSPRRGDAGGVDDVPTHSATRVSRSHSRSISAGSSNSSVSRRVLKSSGKS